MEKSSDEGKIVILMRLNPSKSHDISLPQSLKLIVSTIQEQLPTDDLEVVYSHDGKLAALYFNTVINKERFHDEIVPGMGRWVDHPEQWDTAFPQGTLVHQTDDLIHRILHGEVILLHADFQSRAIAVPLCAIKQRSIMEPSVEKTVLGAKESFIEDIGTNIGLMRRWLKAPGFVVRYYEVGRGSQTRIGIAYLEEEVNKDWLQQIEQKVSSIQTEYLHSHRDLMTQLIGQDNSPFPVYEMTEIPAKVSSELAKGRVALFCEGSPFAILLPTVLLSMLDGPEDLLQGRIMPNFVKVVKVIAQLLALYVPAIYLALVSVDTSILPIQFGLTLAEDQVGLPYAVMVEVFIFMFILDIFIEGTSFVAGNIGPAINVFGSLVIGEAATQTGLMSKMMMIVTAITVIGTYLASYQLSYTVRLWKYPFMAAAALTGVCGILVVTFVLLSHLCTKQSLGVPYLSSLDILHGKKLKIRKSTT